MLPLLLFPLALAQWCPDDYFTEPPVKLLTANLFGSLYPGADSEFRIWTTGHDEDVLLSELEEANQMPEQQLVLSPGGKAVYQLPMDDDFLFLMVKPGKKESRRSSPFSDKANISLSAAWTEEDDGVSVDCSRPSHDSSSSASRYCILNLSPLLESRQESIFVTISVPSKETRAAAIWQIHLSPLDDSERVEATFREEGRQLMRKTQEEESTNTWLTMVSIVGNTGVGKSTVASLLSGNETMFKVKASNQGTTTIGADISPIIPGDQYRMRMQEILAQGPLFEPETSRPLFLIDSEGMSFRGDEVDFVTTGPVAVIANIIVWITTGRLRPPDMLQRIKDYMEGLDRITMGNGTSEQQDYGEFVVVLNMMQVDDQGATDEEMCNELMAWGSSEEDDAIRDEMEQRFKEISCIGLPTVDPDDLPITYPNLEKYPRFREGLFKLGNRLLQESETPISVRVGNSKYEMNSTEAETIIGTLIDAANEGNIDLSDICNVLYSMTKEKVIQKLAKVNMELERATKDMCDNTTQACSPCVCEYRNSAVEKTRNTLTETINFAIEQAEKLCEDRPSIRESITMIKDEILSPWADDSQCTGTLQRSRYLGEVCDISELHSLFEETEGDELTIQCDVLHVCGKTFVHNSELSLDISDIFVSAGATFEQNPPRKGSNGGDGDFGRDGSDGSPGAPGKGIQLEISRNFLTGSEENLVVILRGGEGGDGGRGGDGEPAAPGEPGVPGEKGQDGSDGTNGVNGNIYDSANTINDAGSCSAVLTYPGAIAGGITRYGHENHCCGLGDCDTYKYWQLFTWKYTATSSCEKIDGTDGGPGGSGKDGTPGGDGEDARPGTAGGSGGRGGDGGEAGQWVMEAPGVELEVVLQRIGGKGGAGGLLGKGGSGAQGGAGAVGGAGGLKGDAGKGGAAGYCVHQDREWTAHKNWHEGHSCNHFCTGCSHSHREDPCSNFAKGSFGNYIKTNGKPGEPGAEGTNGLKGADGVPGANTDPAEPGSPGDPGEDASGCC